MESAPPHPAQGSSEKGPGIPSEGSESPAPLAWNTRTFRPMAGVMALILPGLGHFVLGMPRRGRLVMLGVLGLFVTGLVIGGLDAIDSHQDRWWFYAQALTGPMALLVDAAHIHLRHQGQIVQGLGRMNELGMLSCAMAGFMNLIAALDAMFPPLRRRSEGARL